MGEGAGLRVGVLGPLRIQVDDRRVEVAGRLLRALLVCLALARGEVVADDELLQSVWGTGAALASLHAAVARLRRMLEPGRADHAPGALLVRVGTGYALRVPPGGLDADRFTAAVRRAGALLREGRPGPALDELRAGLAEWSGPACADAAGRSFAAAETARLEALRVDAEELALTAQARLGAPAAIAGLEAFTAAHPGRERAWEQLVLALAAEGRPADALAALRRARDHAVATSGAEPGPRLRALQLAVLRGDPTLLVRPDRPKPLLPTTNLPAPISSLVGRERETAEVAERLAHSRLVVLTGPGGTGKTRLALEAARARHDQDGPWLVELADVADGALLAERTGQAVGLGGTGDTAALAAALRDRTALLVLDNCEHLSAAAGAFAAELLGACPGLRVLATSREPLAVAGEAVVPVRPLSAGVDGEAVRLFVARATDAAGHPPDADALDDASALCAELDGLPLAIELAAARAGALTVPDLRAALRDRFAVLQRDGRSGRHATMLSAVDWSYRMLDDDERQVYQALAVFRGGFRLEAAQAVSGRDDAAVVLARLVARSIVVVDDGPRPRYRLLETLRAHAERVTPPDRRSDLTARHRAWVRELADRAGPAMRTRLGSTATARLQEESANIRQALTGAAPEDVLHLGGGFYWFWYREGLTEEGLGHLQAALAATVGAEDPAVIADRCRAGMGVALLGYLRGDLTTAQAALATAGADAERCRDDDVRMQVLSTLAYFEAGGGALTAAREHAEASLAMARRLGDRSAAAESLMVLGEVERRDGRLDDAARHLAESVVEAEASGYTWAGVSSQWIAAKVELAAGRLQQARRLAVAGAAGAQRTGETTSWIVGLTTVAQLDLLLGRPDRAGLIAGAAAWLGGRIGFSPAGMDAELAAWAAALEQARRDPAVADAFARGGRLSPDELGALVAG